jgi:ketosteroid isomerase-like protein
MTTTRAPESNIEIVFADWLDAMRRGDLDTMAARLAPDVVHRGIRDDQICSNRREVLETAGRRAGRLPPVEALELVAAGDDVVLSVRGPGVGAPLDGGEPRGQATIVFTLRAGRIVRMQDYLHRADALAAAGAESRWE